MLQLGTGTAMIMALIVLISLVGFASRRFLMALLLWPWRIAQGADYQNVVMSGFIHADLWHLLFNLVTLYFFGPPLERVIGTTRFIILYLAGLLVSSIGTCLQHRNDPYYTALGASGAILAVLFASIVYFPWQSIIIMPLPVPIPAPLFALGYLAFNYYAVHRTAQARERMQAPGAARGDGSAAPAAADPGEPTGRTPSLLDALLNRPINRHAHLYGALTGLAYVLLEDPGRFQDMLRYYTGRG